VVQDQPEVKVFSIMMALRLLSAARKAAPVAIALTVLSGTAALADCNEDIANLTQKRQAIIEQLNRLSKGAKNELDPVAACPKLRALVAAEKALITYLTKNKEWCAVPDEALSNISAGSAKSSAIANQACKVAAQMKKAQEQQANDALNAPVQRLPSGPL
jgi:hypothetical protein